MVYQDFLAQIRAQIRSSCSAQDMVAQYLALDALWHCSGNSEFYNLLKNFYPDKPDCDIRVAFANNQTLKGFLEREYPSLDEENAFVQLESTLKDEKGPLKLFMYEQGCLLFIDIDRSRKLGAAISRRPLVNTGYRSHNFSWFNNSEIIRPRTGEPLNVIESKGQLCFVPNHPVFDGEPVHLFRALAVPEVMNFLLDREDKFWSRINSCEDGW